MDEYARIRFTLFCSNAPIFPSVIDSAADIQTSQNHALSVPRAAPKRIRNSTAKAAALGPVDINATTGAGAPSYTSGVHTWNGAEAILNPIPTNIRATATQASG